MKTWRCEYCGQENSCREGLDCRKCGAPRPEELEEPEFRDEATSGGEPEDLQKPSFWEILGGVVVLLLGLGLFGLMLHTYDQSSRAPVVPLREYELVVRPAWHTEDRVPTDLQGKLVPAILINPYSDEGAELLEIMGAEGPGQYDPKKISDWGNRLMAWGDRADPYIWFQQYWSDELDGGTWWEHLRSKWARNLFRRFFEEADFILIEKAA